MKEQLNQIRISLDPEHQSPEEIEQLLQDRLPESPMKTLLIRSMREHLIQNLINGTEDQPEKKLEQLPFSGEIAHTIICYWRYLLKQIDTLPETERSDHDPSVTNLWKYKQQSIKKEALRTITLQEKIDHFQINHKLAHDEIVKRYKILAELAKLQKLEHLALKQQVLLMRALLLLLFLIQLLIILFMIF